MERVKERTLVGKCPLPDIAAARKSLYFCIRQETPEACKRVSLFPSAWVEMVSPVICTLYCWHRCLHTGQATAIKSLVGGEKKTGIYECKIGERGKKKRVGDDVSHVYSCILNTRGQQPSLLHVDFWTLCHISRHPISFLTRRGPADVQTPCDRPWYNLRNLPLLLWHGL